ncbi:hypothetical protein EDB81DRAFT_35155 [Dactylonectria macrodidyma]|uniref:Uncharacterized protein n=1 Tax=Dactylonectria macrodidyma TaxID=307937 RepID=A0A9P9FVY2_9HYPO|nr:hypothetical protein EDB81DRAFT_35155 [Dactylonectria macrodidyma]
MSILVNDVSVWSNARSSSRSSSMPWPLALLSQLLCLFALLWLVTVVVARCPLLATFAIPSSHLHVISHLSCDHATAGHQQANKNKSRDADPSVAAALPLRHQPSPCRADKSYVKTERLQIHTQLRTQLRTHQTLPQPSRPDPLNSRTLEPFQVASLLTPPPSESRFLNFFPRPRCQRARPHRLLLASPSFAKPKSSTGIYNNPRHSSP